MSQLVVAATADLPAGVLAASRALLFDVFDDMAEDDWEHCLGGVHAVVLDGDEVLGHSSVVERRMTHDARDLRAGYVEGVGVRLDARGRGHGAAMMDALEGLIGREFDLGALGSTDEGLTFYGRRGWQVWRGELSVAAVDEVRPTPEEHGGVLVLRTRAALDLDGTLTCDWRNGDVW